MPSSGYRKQTMDFGEMSRDLQSAAASFTKMSAAAAGFVGLVGAFKTFELEVTRANSAIGGSAKTFKQLSDAARNFAVISKYSAGEAAGSMVMLAQAGFDAQEAIAAMPHVLQLAQASMENLDLVADTVASTIRTFNLSAEEASRVTNVFAASCVNSLATVNKLAFSFRQVGPVAAEMGMTIEETAAALDVLYNRGLRGEQAGTALRNIMIRLVKPTKDTLQAFSNLGIGLKNADGSARDLQAILSDLKRTNISDTYLAKIFGREALAASKTLIAATTGEYERMKKSITDTNTVARMANAQMNTLDGSLKLIKNALNEVGIILGQSIGPIVKTVAGYVQDFAIYLRTTDSNLIPLIKNFGSFIAILGTAKFGVSKLYGEMQSLASIGGKIGSVLASLGQMSYYGYKVARGGATNPEAVAGISEILNNTKGMAWSEQYSRINEYFKTINNGKGITIQAAAQIKNMTATQIKNTIATVAGAKAWKAFTSTMRVAAITTVKAAIAMAAMTVAFKTYEHFMESRERKKRELDEAFPELEYLNQKIKEAKVAVTADLPAIIQKYKEGMDQLRMANAGITRSEAPEGVTYEDGEAVLSEAFKKRLDDFVNAVTKSIHDTGTLNKKKIYDLGYLSGIPIDLVDVYFAGLEKSVHDFEEKVKNYGTVDRLFKPTSIKDTFIGLSTDDIIDYLNKNAIANKRFKEQLFEIKQDVDSSMNTMRDMLRKAEDMRSLIKPGVSSETVEKIRKAFLTYLLGFTPEDIDRAFIEHDKEIREKLAQHENDLKKLFTDFAKNALSFGLTKEEQGALTVEGTAVINAEMQPIDTSASEKAIADLKKNIGDMAADYKLTWEFLTDIQDSQLRLNKLDAQYTANREAARAKQKATVEALNKVLPQEEFTWKNIQNSVMSIDSSTGELVIKNKLLAEASKITDDASREEAQNQIEILDLTIKQYNQQQKLIEQDKARLAIVDGRYKYEQEHLRHLQEEIAKYDSNATTSGFWKNVSNGLEAGRLGLESQIDSFYKQAKNGMQGFADYMTDSMNNIVDNWGKGWSSMKDALKSTLVDMLKDLAHYYMKQAIYMSLTGLTKGLFGGSETNETNGTVASTIIQGANAIKKKNGGAFEHGLQTFANGGIVTGPTLFNHRFGKGLMGEAGPEAIMPLRRDSQGRLGVEASGGSVLNYAPSFNINMVTGELDSKTSQKTANRMTKELDSKVKSAVLLVLAKEKRPGGLLYGGTKWQQA